MFGYLKSPEDSRDVIFGGPAVNYDSYELKSIEPIRDQGSDLRCRMYHRHDAMAQ